MSGPSWSLAGYLILYVPCPPRLAQEKTVYKAVDLSGAVRYPSALVTDNSRLVITADYKISALCSSLVPDLLLFFFPAPLSISEPYVGPRNSQGLLPCLVCVRGTLQSCSQTQSPGNSVQLLPVCHVQSRAMGTGNSLEARHFTRKWSGSEHQTGHSV